MERERPRKGWSRSQQGDLAAAEHLMVGHLHEVIEEDEVGHLLVRRVPGKGCGVGVRAGVILGLR